MSVPNSEAPFVANPKQRELAACWFHPSTRVVIAGGAIRSGKTQAAGRLLVETALRTQGLYMVSRMTYRELRDSTQKAMLHGDGALPPLIPPEAIDYYRASDELVRLRNGSEIIFRSLDEPGKILNLTLNAIFVDQIEEMAEGDEGERFFNTLFGRLSDPRGPRKLIGVANPGPMTHWLFRRCVNRKTADPRTAYVHFSMRDNAENLPPDYVSTMYEAEQSRPHWFKTYVLGEWGAFEGAAYEEFSEDAHVLDPFTLPDVWERFQGMDHGQQNPTCWLAFAVDHDGNVIVFDEYYSPGYVSAHAAAVLARKRFWRGSDERAYMVAYADPSIGSNSGMSKNGRPWNILAEYHEHGIDWLAKGNNDREAGYARICELLRRDPQRPFPEWHPRRGELGAPQLYIFRPCENLIIQLKSAPIETDGLRAGEAVGQKWETTNGHAHAALRYGALSHPLPTPLPAVTPTDPRTLAFIEYERRRDSEDAPRRRATVSV